MSRPDIPRVVLYGRISEDVTGESLGVNRQLEHGRDLATARGFEVVAEVSDNDISALRGKHRPGYEQVLNLVRSGAVDHVVVWQTSRLLRNRRERAEAIELFGKQRVGIITVKGQDLDLSNAYGRGMAGMLGEFDTMESEVKSERVAAAAADRARSGRPNSTLGYGWIAEGKGRQARYLEHPEHAQVVREIIKRLVSGESLLGVTTDLNRRGVSGPVVGTWGKTSVKKLALRASNAGLRVHHRGRPTETLFPGDWPALVSRSDWEKVTALLTEPARRTNGTARPGARKHLLTWGIGACGVCGGYLRVSLKGHQKYGTKKHLYVCDDKGCVGRDQANVDALVREVVIERLSRPDALDWLLGDEDEAKRAAERALGLKGRLDDAADKYAEDRITADQLDRITAKLRPQIEKAEREQKQHMMSLDLDMLTTLAGPKARQLWENELGISQKRAVLETLNVRVEIHRVTRRGPGFDPESVRFEWNA